MADNTTLPVGAGGDTIATDDVAAIGAKIPRGKIALGADGAFDGDVSAALPLPVGGSGPLAIGKPEDGPHANGDVGVLLLAVRRDAEAVGSGTDGDYSTVNVDDSGRLRVNASGVAVPVTDNGGSLTVDGAVSVSDGGGSLTVDDGGASLTVDGTVSVSGAVDTELPAAAALADAAANPSTPTIGAAGLVYNGATWDRARGDTANGLDVDVTRVSGNVAVTSGAASQADGHSATLGAQADAASGSDTATASLIAHFKRLLQRLTVLIGQLPAALTGSGNLKVALVESVSTQPVSGTVSISGTVPVDTELPAAAALADNTANPTVPSLGSLNLIYDGATWDRMPGNSADGQLVDLGANNDVIASGNVAHDGVDSGNPVKSGAVARTSEPAAVANADRVNMIADVVGKQIVLPYSLPEDSLNGATSDITNTTSTSVIAAQGAGVRIYVTEILIQNSHATVGTWVNVTDGSGGAVLHSVYCVALGGGAALVFPKPLRLTANTALHVVCVTTGANVRASASGYKGA